MSLTYHKTDKYHIFDAVWAREGTNFLVSAQLKIPVVDDPMEKIEEVFNLIEEAKETYEKTNKVHLVSSKARVVDD